jgi:hypothetical protein
MSYGSNVTDLWTRAAECVDKILRGAKPGDLPVGSRLSFSSSSISRRPKRSSGCQVCLQKAGNGYWPYPPCY